MLNSITKGDKRRVVVLNYCWLNMLCSLHFKLCTAVLVLLLLHITYVVVDHLVWERGGC